MVVFFLVRRSTGVLDRSDFTKIEEQNLRTIFKNRRGEPADFTGGRPSLGNSDRRNSADFTGGRPSLENSDRRMKGTEPADELLAMDPLVRFLESAGEGNRTGGRKHRRRDAI
ncbi:unnamed protein product [Cuscuta campestris]|uniref:Uncharacterized protein n=1 Tax=Cuscuta campestris TaxID=132261 RepID=A0A484M6X8_9ASTE|nr:unnamed protein product [Cuscuta campestris]